MPIFYIIAAIIVSALVATALAPKTPKPRPASLEDFDVPTAEEGRPLPVHFGSPDDVAANVIWYGDLRTEAIKAKGGKK